MAFKVICTGKNRFWGEEGKIIFIGDYQLVFGLQQGYIKNKVEYVGHGKFQRGAILKDHKIGLPIRKVDVLKEIKMQTSAYDRILKELKFIDKKRKDIISLVKPNLK